MPNLARNLEHWRKLARHGVATTQIPDLEVRMRMLQAVLGYEWTWEAEGRDADFAKRRLSPTRRIVSASLVVIETRKS
jgi:hypothetical protein